MEIHEGRFKFTFKNDVSATKYDNTPFYKNRYIRLEGGKGLDVLAATSNALYLIEVKDCSQTAESQDKWRRAYSGGRSMNTLAMEIAQKVAHTCAALTGVATFGERAADGQELLPMVRQFGDGKIASLERKLLVLLYLEGDFSCKARSNKMIYRDICQRIKKNLQWLNCQVDVVSTQTHHASEFSVQLIPA